MFMQHYKMQLAFTVWWKNGKFVKSFDQSKKKTCFCQQKKGKQRSIGCGRSSKTERYKGNVKEQSGCEKTPKTSWEDVANHIWEGTAW